MRMRFLGMLGLALLLAPAARAELITFEQPTYSNAALLSNVNGQDGWSATPSSGSDAWIIFNGQGINTTQVMWNNAPNGTSATAERAFASPTRAGTLTYDLRPNNTGTSVGHWLLLRDSPATGYALQFQSRAASKSNTNDEFRIFSAGNEYLSPDITAIDFSSSAWYEVKIDFDLDDLTASANGTLDVQVMRLDGTPQVVWTQNNVPVNSLMPNIGLFRDHGSTATASFATLIDNIDFQPIPEPGTLTIASLGLGTLLRLRRHRR